MRVHVCCYSRQMNMKKESPGGTHEILGKGCVDPDGNLSVTIKMKHDIL